MPILSITIPTWNRSEFFNQQIERISSQLTSDVEVIACLNPPNPDYVLPDWLKVFRNRIHLPGWDNLLVAVTQARGDYCWILSDDDLLLPGAIDTVLDTLRSYPGLVIAHDGRFNIGCDYGSRFATYGEFVSATNTVPIVGAHTLCSANIFRRDTFDFEYAIEKQDTLYNFFYGMLRHIFNKPVSITKDPVFVPGPIETASIHRTSPQQISDHVASYPQVIRDIEAWVELNTGAKPFPWMPGDGFYQ